MINLGLIGYPLGHSLSPQMHAAALKQAGLEGEYRMYPVEPGAQCAAGLKSLVARLRAGEFQGLNVTIPHKQAVMAFLDDLTPEARAIGAANCLSARNGVVTGGNTDAPGFLADVLRLLETDPSRVGNCALVLGAGGSARAVVFALARAGWQVTVAARRVEQADGLVDAFGKDIRPVQLDAHALSMLETPDLIVNTTPVGMHLAIDGSPWPQGLPLPANAAVYDLVYRPRETALVRAARAAGLRAETGLGMLVEQAALSFELWTGCPADRSAMRAAVEEL
jgi:shikimate dehydrogenase